MHKINPPKQKSNVKIERKKTIGNTLDAVEHYLHGKGRAMELSWGTRKELFGSPENVRVVNRLVNGKAINLSGNFRVDLTKKTFHVGRTRVDYSTSCTTIKCTTSFKAFVGDGFRDPLDIGQMTRDLINLEIPGGTPYNYIPWEYSISYKNPGYPIGNNINR